MIDSKELCWSENNSGFFSFEPAEIFSWQKQAKH